MSVGMRPKGGCGCPSRRPESPKTGRALAMLVIDERVADRPDLQGAYFEVHDKIDAELHTVGLRHFGEAIAQRMKLIEMLAAQFNNDSRMIRRLCLEVLDRVASTLDPE